VVSVDFTLVIFTLSFLLFLALMDFFFFKPVLSIIRKREFKISSDLEKIEQLKSDIESRVSNDEAFKIIREARTIASQILSKARDEALLSKEKFLEELSIELKLKHSKAVEEIKKQSAECLLSLEPSTFEIAELIFQKLIGREEIKI
jgi:F-type H+-transporting ATPase subunit b